jgi:phosphatidylglycerophosphate synthase
MTRIYMPKWKFWFTAVVLLAIIVFLLVSNAPYSVKLSLVLLFALVIVMSYLMAYRRLPLYELGK